MGKGVLWTAYWLVIQKRVRMEALPTCLGAAVAQAAELEFAEVTSEKRGEISMRFETDIEELNQEIDQAAEEGSQELDKPDIGTGRRNAETEAQEEGLEAETQDCWDTGNNRSPVICTSPTPDQVQNISNQKEMPLRQPRRIRTLSIRKKKSDGGRTSVEQVFGNILLKCRPLTVGNCRDFVPSGRRISAISQGKTGDMENNSCSSSWLLPFQIFIFAGWR